MCTQSAAQQDLPVIITPLIRPRMPWRVATVEALPGFCLRVQFMDGSEGMVNLAALIQSSDAGVFAVLADPALFTQVRVEYGAVTWPGEIDLAPDVMYAEIKKAGTWVLQQGTLPTPG